MHSQAPMVSTTTSYPLGDNHPNDPNIADQRQIVFLLSVILTPLAAVLVLLRFLSSIRHHRRFLAVDYTLLLAIVLYAGISAEQILSLKNEMIRDDDFVRQWKLFYAWRITHSAAKIAAQMGILFMLREAFSLRNRWFRWAWLTATVLTVSTGILAIFINALQCISPSRFWELSGSSNGQCLESMVVILLATIPFGVSSVFLLAMPILPIYFSKVSRWWKAGMWALWIVGFFLTWCIGATPSVMMYGGDWDFRAGNMYLDGYLISTIEVFGGILIAVVPGAVRVFARRDTVSPVISDGVEEDDSAGRRKK